MCLAPEDTMYDESNTHGARDFIAPGDEVFVKAPPSDELQVDVVRYRAELHEWADDLRAEAGLRVLSAPLYRRRRAHDHKSMALEFAQRRKVAVALGLEEDELCRSVLDAMDTQVHGSCAYCGCNFTVVAVVDVAVLGLVGKVCGLCGRELRKYSAVPLVRIVPENAEERWKGWLPW